MHRFTYYNIPVPSLYSKVLNYILSLVTRVTQNLRNLIHYLQSYYTEPILPLLEGRIYFGLSSGVLRHRQLRASMDRIEAEEGN